MDKGYNLCYYKKLSGQVREALVSYELLPSSKIHDKRTHEVYDLIKTNLAKVIKIETLQGKELDCAYLNRYPDLRNEIKKGEIIRFKHSNFDDNNDNQSYLALYTTRVGAMNLSNQISKNFTGNTFKYNKNGSLCEKNVYVNSIKCHTFGYYDSVFNPLNYSWTYEQNIGQSFPTIREYVYNRHENPVAQYLIHQGKIIHKTIYDQTNHPRSIYLDKIRVGDTPMTTLG